MNSNPVESIREDWLVKRLIERSNGRRIRSFILSVAIPDEINDAEYTEIISRLLIALPGPALLNSPPLSPQAASDMIQEFSQ